MTTLSLKFGPSLAFKIGALVLLLATNAHAQYAIEWFTIDGGGGTSAGGVYSLKCPTKCGWILRGEPVVRKARKSREGIKAKQVVGEVRVAGQGAGL